MRWLMLIGVMFLSGCITTTAARQKYLAENPKTLERIANAMLEGKIVKYMPKEAVRLAWGNPCWYCYGTRKSSWGDTWEYNMFGSARPGAGTLVFFDENDRVRGWSE